MTAPIHASHVQPSDIGEILPFATSERVVFTQVAILTADTVLRWKAPADGILEEGWFVCLDNGSAAGPNTMDIHKNGSTVLTAVMSIAHDDIDNVEVAAAFDTDEHTVERGDIITLVAAAGATNQTDASAGFTFRLLGR